MYIIIKRTKAEHLKDKLRKIKDVIEDVTECLEEASEESRERDGYRERSRYEEDYVDDRDMARGGRGRSGGGRY